MKIKSMVSAVIGSGVIVYSLKYMGVLNDWKSLIIFSAFFIVWVITYLDTWDVRKD